MNNKLQVEIIIDNCKDCPNHCIERIYTPDSFEHEMGLYCTKFKDVLGKHSNGRLVASDDVDVTEYTQIPNWCPLLPECKEGKIVRLSDDVKLLVLAGPPRTYKTAIIKKLNNLKSLEVLDLSQGLECTKQKLTDVAYTNLSGNILVTSCISRLDYERLREEFGDIGKNIKFIYTFDTTAEATEDGITNIVKDILYFFLSDN